MRNFLLLCLGVIGATLPSVRANADTLPADYREKALVALGIPQPPNPGSIIRLYQPGVAELTNGEDQRPTHAVRVDWSLADRHGKLTFSTTVGVVLFRDGTAIKVVNADQVRWLFAEPKPESKSPKPPSSAAPAGATP